MVSDQGQYHCRGCLGCVVYLGGGLVLIRNEPSWCLSQGEFRVVAPEKGGDGFHGGVQWDAVEDKFGPAGFSVNPANGHVVSEGPLECQEVWFVVSASG